ncbi:MAG TPA: hypothetical protein VK654_17500 [Nitrospirota bacterium]|nr:hypothetical protein [Nitrospirota bacterium]
MKTLVMRIVLMSILAALTSTCGHSDLPKYQTLGDLRILDVLVDKPEANPGDVVTFTPVLSDLLGNGRQINYSVQACVDPGLAFGADPVCTIPDPASIQSGSLTIPAGADATYTDAVSPFTLTMPDSATMFAGRSPADRYNGVIYLVQFNIGITNGPAINSFLRVFVSDPSVKTSLNQNPTSSIDLNDTPVLDEFTTRTTIAMPVTAVNFRATSPASSLETYQYMQPDGTLLTRTEQMLHSWFTTDGEFDYSRTDNGTENKWSSAAKPSGRSAVIVVITRDGRGGSTFKKIAMN